MDLFRCMRPMPFNCIFWCSCFDIYHSGLARSVPFFVTVYIIKISTVPEEEKKKEKKRLYTHWKGSFRRGKEVLNHIVFLLLEAWTKKSLVAINLEIDLLRWDIWSEPQSPHKKLSCLPFTACYTLRLTPLSMFL